MGICEINLDSMYSLCLVLPLCLQDQLLQDGIVAGYDTYGQHLTAAAVLLSASSYAEPMALVIDCMCCIGSGLEYDACFDFTGDVFIFFVIVAKGVVCDAGAKTRG